MNGTKKGFTLIELMVVILIVSILAAAAIPMMRGRIDSAKWAEANATAGTIKSAVRVYFAQSGVQGPTGLLSVVASQNLLGFDATDLTGTYFVPGDYNIISVSTDGIPVITVTASQANAPTAGDAYQLELDGDWVKQ